MPPILKKNNIQKKEETICQDIFFRNAAYDYKTLTKYGRTTLLISKVYLHIDLKRIRKFIIAVLH